MDGHKLQLKASEKQVASQRTNTKAANKKGATPKTKLIQRCRRYAEQYSFDAGTEGRTGACKLAILFVATLSSRPR